MHPKELEEEETHVTMTGKKSHLLCLSIHIGTVLVANIHDIKHKINLKIYSEGCKSNYLNGAPNRFYQH